MKVGRVEAVFMSCDREVTAESWTWLDLYGRGQREAYDSIAYYTGH